MSDPSLADGLDELYKKAYAEGYRAGQIAMRERIYKDLGWTGAAHLVLKAKKLPIEEARDEK